MILASYMPQADVMALHDPQGPPDAPDDADVISLEILGVDVFDIDTENGTQLTVRRALVSSAGPAVLVGDRAEANEDAIRREQMPDRIVIAIGTARAQLAAIRARRGSARFRPGEVK
jgi:hypothetical protein